MKKLLIAVGVLMIVLLISGGAYVAYSSVKAKETIRVQTSTEIPATFTNPFVQKPTTGFGAANATVVVSELFAAPTPTPYQNPFGSTSSANQQYQNPFEQLK